MATDDITVVSSPCLCGKGRIAVTQTSPDHPWVRASQIHYEADLDCSACSKEYVVKTEFGGELPWLARREDVQKRAAAEKTLREAEQSFAASPLGKSLIPHVVAEIDGQPSLAAMHRILQRHRLAYVSLATYRKRPFGGAEAMKNPLGHTLATIGANSSFPGVDPEPFKAKLAEFEALQNLVRAAKIDVIETGARWMKR